MLPNLSPFEVFRPARSWGQEGVFSACAGDLLYTSQNELRSILNYVGYEVETNRPCVIVIATQFSEAAWTVRACVMSIHYPYSVYLGVGRRSDRIAFGACLCGFGSGCGRRRRDPHGPSAADAGIDVMYQIV